MSLSLRTLGSSLDTVFVHHCHLFLSIFHNPKDSSAMSTQLEHSAAHLLSIPLFASTCTLICVSTGKSLYCPATILHVNPFLYVKHILLNGCLFSDNRLPLHNTVFRDLLKRYQFLMHVFKTSAHCH